MIKKGNLLLIFIIGLFLMPIMVYGEENTEYFDSLFSNNEYTVNTDVEFKDNNMADIVYQAIQKEAYTNNDGIRIFASYPSCNAEKTECDFSIGKHVQEPGNTWYTFKEIKKYQNIKIKTNSNIADRFSMIKDNKMVINYDEKMFTDDNEKNSYISNYVSSFNEYSSSKSVSYQYNSWAKYIIRFENSTKAFIKRVDTVEFDYHETDYSEEFKKLTSDGKVVINTNAELSEKLVSTHLSNNYLGTSNFRITGHLKDNKAYVQRVKYASGGKTEILETHLIEFSVKNNVDTSLYKTVNNGKIDVPTSKFESPYELRNYLSQTLNLYNDNNKRVETTSILEETDSIVLKYAEYDKNYHPSNIQYYKVDINYVGYSKEYSAEFTKDVGTKIVVNSDDKNQSIINQTIGYKYNIISCNADYSSCVVALFNYDNKTVEVHKVDVVFDTTLSERFKDYFNIKEDRSIDILVDDTTKDGFYAYFYYYDDETEENYDYSCSYDYSTKNISCLLTIRNYKTSRSEQHRVTANLIKSEKTDSYKKVVVDTKIVYPGEIQNVFERLYGDDFHREEDESKISTNRCYPEKGGCNVLIRNSSKNLETHFVPVELKEGKSPKFTELFPGDTIEIPAVLRNNEDYISDVFYNYISRKTKEYAYLYGYKDGKALIELGNTEAHTYNIKFVEGDQEKAKTVDEIVSNIDEKEISVTIEDLEFLNMFYYSPDGYFNSQIKTASLDDAISEIVTNKHISYSFTPRMGGGTPYEFGMGGLLLLYYDGIAYNITNEAIGVGAKQVLYIPNDTENTPEAYVKAAQKKINDYLGTDSGVIIKFNGPADNEALDELDWDLTNCDKNEYTLIHKDKKVSVLIIKDSNKNIKPDFVASDILNNVIIKAEETSYPADTIVSTDIMKEDTKEFKAILKTIKAETAQVIDINLYSPSVGEIKDFNKGAVFKVTVPLSNEKLMDKKLVAYYLDDEGNIISEHPVVVEDGMATFETTHFSTYVIAEKKQSILPELPNTVDAIFYFVGIAAIAVLGMKLSKKYISKKN